jgi:hypothetical protein
MEPNIKTWVELVGEGQLLQIKEACHPPKKKPLWLIKHLDNEQLAEVCYRMFEKEEDLRAIAKMVRDEWGINPSGKWQLQDYTRGMEQLKRRLATPMSKHIMGKRNPEEKRKAKALKKKHLRIFKKLDPLGRLGWIVEQQTKRYAMARVKEKALKMPLDITDTIAANLTTQIRTYAEMGIKLGLLQGVPEEINVNLKAKADLVMAHFIAGDGQKMIRAANSYLEDMAGQCVDLEIDSETGEFVIAGNKKCAQLE